MPCSELAGYNILTGRNQRVPANFGEVHFNDFPLDPPNVLFVLSEPENYRTTIEAAIAV
jgi:hypothetical protein